MATVSRREIDKYIKFFCIKAAQTIIQARSGDKSATRCSPDTIGVDWFNIALPSGVVVTEVQNEIKTIYGRSCPAVCDSFSIDVILRTADGLDILAEAWTIYATDKTDPNVKVCFTVYNKLAVLLKTIISFSRALPAYRISRRRNKDFRFLYKLHSGGRRSSPPDCSLTQSTIGSVGTPFYNVSVEVAYRDVIHIDGQQTAYKPPTPLRQSDSNSSKEQSKTQEVTPQGIVDQIAKAALENVTGTPSSQLPTLSSPGSSTTIDHNSWMSKEIRDAIGEIEFIERPPSASDICRDKTAETSKNHQCDTAWKDTELNLSEPGLSSLEPYNKNLDLEPHIHGSSFSSEPRHWPDDKTDGFSNPFYMCQAAFADLSTASDSLASVPVLPSTPPLLSLLEEKMVTRNKDADSVKEVEQGLDNLLKTNTHKPEESVTSQNKKENASNNQSMEDGQPQAHAVGFEDDFVLVELRPAFSYKEGEAVALFRDTKKPPMLSMFAPQKYDDHDAQTLKEILDHYEEQFQDFDHFFKRLGCLEVS